MESHMDLGKPFYYRSLCFLGERWVAAQPLFSESRFYQEGEIISENLELSLFELAKNLHGKEY
jgi:hypothetical protein